jgi:hypothetical protein
MGYKYVGDSNQLVFHFESGTYASLSGARQWIGMVQDHIPTEVTNTTPVRYQGNYSRGVGIFTNGRLEYGGTFTYHPQDWKFLAFAIGSTQVLAGSKLIREADSDDKNYAIQSQPLSSFTLEASKNTAATGSNFIRTFKGCIVDSYRLNFVEGEIATAEVDYVAQNVVPSSGTITAVTPRTNKPYMWSDVNIHLPSGTKLSNCTEFRFEVNNNLSARYPLNGSRTTEEVKPLRRDYTVNTTFLMDSSNAMDLYNTYYTNGNEFNSMAEIKSATGSAYIIMSGCKMTSMSTPDPVEGLTEQTCTINPTNIYVNVYDAIGSYNAW